MNKLSGLALSLLVLLSVALLFGIFYLGALRPRVKLERKLAAQLFAKQTLVQEIGHAVSGKLGPTAEISGLKRDIEEIEAKIPSDFELGQFWEQISLATAETGVKLTKLEQVSVESGVEFDQILVKIGLNGNFAALVETLDALATLPRIVHVSEINLNSTKNKLNAELTVILYRIKNLEKST